MCVDVGTDIENCLVSKYTGFLKTELRAERVKLLGSSKNSRGQIVHLLEVVGDVGVVAMARLHMRQGGWQIMWEDDARDNGYLENCVFNPPPGPRRSKRLSQI